MCWSTTHAPGTITSLFLAQILHPSCFQAPSLRFPVKSPPGAVSSPGLGVALPHRNAIRLQPFICELEPFQEEEGIPGRLPARPGSPASSRLPKCPAGAAGAPQNRERSHASQASAPLERANPPLRGPVLCRLGLSPATSLTASDPCGYPPPGSHLCQGGGGRWGRAASFAGGSDSGTASALLSEPIPLAMPWEDAVPPLATHAKVFPRRVLRPGLAVPTPTAAGAEPSPCLGCASSPAALWTVAAVENSEFCCRSWFPLLGSPLQVGGCPAPARPPRPRGLEGMPWHPEGWD